MPNPTLINALALAHAWHRELLRTGETIDALAERVDEYPQRIHHLLPLAQLGPVVTRAILTGALSPNTSLKRLLAVARRLDWDAQASMLGLHASSSKR